jgi:hypothetical protein
MFFGSWYAFMRTPADKLRYVATVVTHDLSPLNRAAKRGQGVNRTAQRTLDKIQLGVQLHNTAHFPISAFLEFADTEMEDKRPPRTDYPKAPVTVTPGNTIVMLDVPIEMVGTPCAKLEGRMFIKVKYGFPKNEKYELSFKAKIEALIRHDGFIQATYTHWDTNQPELLKIGQG